LNLGIALYDATRKSVIVAEFRPGQSTLSLELGYQHSEGLNRLLQRKPGEIDLRAIDSELITQAPGIRMLLASTQPRDAQYVGAVASFEAIARQLCHLASYVIYDLGPSLTPLTDKVLPHCDEIIIVVEPVPQTILQTKALIEDLSGKGINDGRLSVVLINRLRSGLQLSWSQVQEQMGRNIATIFTPAPELAYQAALHNTPMILQQPDSLTTQQFIKLAEKVMHRNQ
jgi:MinD-like ATPase involved in chromosome partitioning or flagellar assembly